MVARGVGVLVEVGGRGGGGVCWLVGARVRGVWSEWIPGSVGRRGKVVVSGGGGGEAGLGWVGGWVWGSGVGFGGLRGGVCTGVAGICVRHIALSGWCSESFRCSTLSTEALSRSPARGLLLRMNRTLDLDY